MANCIEPVTPASPATVMAAQPGVETNCADTSVLSSVAVIKVVGSAPPFHRTVEPKEKPVPKTTSMNAGAPATAEIGLRVEIVGAGGLTVNVSAGEVDPPAFVTAMVAVPGVAMLDAGTLAVI